MLIHSLNRQTRTHWTEMRTDSHSLTKHRDKDTLTCSPNTVDRHPLTVHRDEDRHSLNTETRTHSLAHWTQRTLTENQDKDTLTCSLNTEDTHSLNTEDTHSLAHWTQRTLTHWTPRQGHTRLLTEHRGHSLTEHWDKDTLTCSLNTEDTHWTQRQWQTLTHWTQRQGHSLTHWTETRTDTNSLNRDKDRHSPTHWTETRTDTHLLTEHRGKDRHLLTEHRDKDRHSLTHSLNTDKNWSGQACCCLLALLLTSNSPLRLSSASIVSPPLICPVSMMASCSSSSLWMHKHGTVKPLVKGCADAGQETNVLLRPCSLSGPIPFRGWVFFLTPHPPIFFRTHPSSKSTLFHNHFLYISM